MVLSENLNSSLINRKYKKEVEVMTKKRSSANSSKKILEQLDSCLECGGKLVIKTEINVVDGKSFPMDVKQCVKCGEIYVDPKETDRIIKLTHPSIIDRIKKLFSVPKEEKISLFEGKVL